MEVVVDGTDAPVSTAGLATFHDLFETLRKALGQKRRVMVWVKLDGTALSPDEQAALKGRALPPQGRLEIGTADRVRLAADTARDLIPYLDALEGTHQEAAEQVIAANYRTAMERFKDCFDGWAILMGALRNISSIAGVDLGALRSGGGPAGGEIRRIQESLAGFKSAFDQADVVRLGDITQYDLKPQLGAVRGLLETLRRLLLESDSAPR